jgi:CRP-like cAMP-binding protein
MNNLQINIAEQITSGFISIDSIEDFEKILKRFPNDPALHRSFSDLLVKNNLPNAATISYGKAARLYLERGHLLQAVVSKILQWEIRSPAFKEAQPFFLALREGSYPDTPMKYLFDKLSNPEILAVMKNSLIIQLPAGQMVKKVGDEEHDLCFVVSGTLKKSIYKPLEQKGTTVYIKSDFYLSENDFFGNIYPFENKSVSESYIETITRVELVQISKKVLKQIVAKYSNVKRGLTALYNFKSNIDKIKDLPKNREGERHKIVKKMTLEIYPEAASNFPIILGGYSRDISIGGTCVVLDTTDIHVSNSIASFHKTIQNGTLKMSFPCEGMELRVSGKIVWTQEVTFIGEKTLALGIHFQDLSPKLRGMLFVFTDNSNNK